MRSDNSNLTPGWIIGFGVFVLGALFEPLLMILGAMIVISGGAAKIVESRQVKYQEMKSEQHQERDMVLEEKTA